MQPRRGADLPRVHWSISSAAGTRHVVMGVVALTASACFHYDFSGCNGDFGVGSGGAGGAPEGGPVVHDMDPWTGTVFDKSCTLATEGDEVRECVDFFVHPSKQRARCPSTPDRKYVESTTPCEHAKYGGCVGGNRHWYCAIDWKYEAKSVSQVEIECQAAQDGYQAP